jgi:hypothetical protein
VGHADSTARILIPDSTQEKILATLEEPVIFSVFFLTVKLVNE